MENTKENRQLRIEKRRAKERLNIFARLPVTYAASRTQGQRFLKHAGGLSIVEWRTIWDLHECGPLTVRDLATNQRADHSLLSRALPEMQRKGYVSMRRDDEDKRQTIVEITKEGEKAYALAAPVMQRRRNALRETFSPEEIEVFAEYLDRLETFLRIPVEDMLDDILEEKETS